MTATTPTKKSPRIAGARFLIPPFVHSELITLLVGAKSAGKSTLLTGVAADFSNGRNPFTKKKLNVENRNVLFFSLEDSSERCEYRFKAAGGDMKFFHLGKAQSITDRSTVGMDFGRAKPALVIIDCLSPFFGSSQGERQVNDNYAFLLRMVHRYKCSIILVHHAHEAPSSNKTVRGSARITEAVRCGLFFTRSSRVANASDMFNYKPYDAVFPTARFHLTKVGPVEMFTKVEIGLKWTYEDHRGDVYITEKAKKKFLDARAKELYVALEDERTKSIEQFFFEMNEMKEQSGHSRNVMKKIAQMMTYQDYLRASQSERDKLK